MLKRSIVSAAIFVSIAISAQIKQAPETEFRLTQDIISFPITLVNAYPFISGEINGIKGKFMFDTGNGLDIDINNNIIPLPNQSVIGKGIVTSGQNFEIYNNEVIDDVKLVNGLHYKNLKNVKSSNYDFLQNDITPDCIGYIGYKYFEGYLFKLDYIKRQLTFYKNTEERQKNKDFLKGEKLITVLDFETRKLPNIPIMKVKIGKVNSILTFDTGTYGHADINENDVTTLRNKNLFIDIGKDSGDNDLITLKDVKLNSHFKIDLNALYYEKGQNYDFVKEAMGITEDNYITIGYRLYVEYKTVWDYDNKKIYILER